MCTLSMYKELKGIRNCHDINRKNLSHIEYLLFLNYVKKPLGSLCTRHCSKHLMCGNS